MEKKYNNIETEKSLNKLWIEKKYFSTHSNKKKPFTIILPPPNITGKLHLGHALNGCIQDALIRYKKLNNFDVLFLPSFDHAGISAQIRVEKNLAAKNINKNTIGKKAFLIELEKWKTQNQKTIKDQWYQLGLALDYSHQRYTLDDKMIKLIQEVFVKMYNDDLIYRGPRGIYWDIKQQTALSNIEVVYKETKSKMFYIKYPIKNSDEYLTIATTRPETIYSDVAVVFNELDPRYQKYKNKIIMNPLNQRELAVITDEYIDLKFGTGIMKCSAHAEIDIKIIDKNNLKIIECIDKFGMMNQEAFEFSGLDRFLAREKIVEKLTKDNLIFKVEEINNKIGYSDRSNEVIEILYSTQWFVKMDRLSTMVLKHLESDDTVEFHPLRFKDTIKTWMNNVYDWTISRQLWWGHRIPAWYKNNELKVQVDSPGQGWIQDPDVLDTWFSSGIIPFSFFDWPEQTNELKRYFPTDVLVTAYDIIFFWVARMYFQSLSLTSKKPFKKVIFHGLIRDQNGIKMSKSLGNGIDPMELIKTHGSDSLRWFLLTKGKLGFDLRFSKKDMDFAWNICNKLWNISRYIIDKMPHSSGEVNDIDLWIENKLNNLIIKTNNVFENNEFTIFGKEVQHFIFDDLSSWYIEMSKNLPNQQFAIKILKKLLILVHPILPFISDDIFHKITNHSILEESWPKSSNIKNVDYIDEIILIIKKIRAFREEEKLGSKTILKISLSKSFSEKSIAIVTKMAKCEITSVNEGIKIPCADFIIKIKLTSEMRKNRDVSKAKKIAFLQNEIKRSKQILENKNFIAKAPQAKIDNETKKYKKYQDQLKALL